MYLVDTDIVIWVLRNNQQYVDAIQRLKSKAPLSISTMTIAEIYKNVFPSEILRTEEVLNKFIIWDITANIAKLGGLYWKQYSKKFNNLHILDCLIAATAKEHSLTLLSLNIRHYPMKDILIFDPVKIKS